jgi:hypothetical protein
MAKRDGGWTTITDRGASLPGQDQEVEFTLAGLGEQVLRGSFHAEKRPFTEGIKWVFIARDESGRTKSYRHGVTRWRPAAAAGKAARG